MTVLAGRYELGEELGSGGMATVVAAHDRDLDRPVAVKLLRATPDAITRQRFVHEARTAARFHHPNAVTVHDAGEHEGQPYIVMELVRGRSLADHVSAAAPLAPDEAIAIVLGVLDALAAAHARGLVHRDVKPSNVLLPDEGGVRIADFGIAKALDDATGGLTTAGTIIGTVSYMAPELVEGASATPASDVYSVGCVLYELLTRRPPFTGDSSLSIAYAQVRRAVHPITAHRSDLPDELVAVVERALEKDPQQRYPDAGAMRAALLDGPAAVPSPRTMPLAGAAAIAGDAPTRAQQVVTDPAEPRRRPVPLMLALAALAVVALAIIALERGWLGGAEPSEEAVEVVDDGDAPVDEPAPPDPAESDTDEPEPDEPETDAEEPDDAGDDPPPDEPADPAALPDLVAFLTAAEPGTYGEKHDDLLADLLALREEDDPEERAEDAAALREDVADWVADGELDPHVGELADRILADMAAAG